MDMRENDGVTKIAEDRGLWQGDMLVATVKAQREAETHR
jgi:hypothetical protein